MNILFAVPSKNRDDVFQKNAYQILTWLPKDNWRIFVEPQDKEKYERFQNVVVIPENDRGLGYCEMQIKKYAEENGFDLVFKMDDDVRGFTDYRERLDCRRSAERLLSLCPSWFSMFESYSLLGAIGFNYAFQMFETFEYKPIKRLQTCYIVRTSFWNPQEEISVFEDFATALSLLVRGYKVLLCGLTGIILGIEVGGGQGGHQSFDRKEKSLKEIDVLRKIYPPLGFRKVNKRWQVEPDVKTIKL